jgi:Fe-S cluster assembly protein SufD
MIEQQYIDLFEKYRGDLDANSSNGMNAHRDAAFETFKQIGFPTSKQEDYKHSNIVRVFDADLGLNLRNIPIPVNPYEAFKCDVPNLNTHTYFLINDRFYNEVEQGEGLPEGVFAGSLRQFSEEHPEVFEKYYAKIADSTDNGIVAYNTMFVQDGFVIYVPKNIEVEKPLQLINILRGGVDLNVRTPVEASSNTEVSPENKDIVSVVADGTE